MPGNSRVSPFNKAGLKQREAERREKAKASQATEVAEPIMPEVAAHVVRPPQIALTAPEGLTPQDSAVAVVEQVAGQLFAEMVEKKAGLETALRAVNVDALTFFTALEHSQAMRQWYRSVKAAQSVMEVEAIGEVISEMEEAAGDELIGNSTRQAKMALAKTKLEQARWAAQRLLPALYGEKSQSDVSGKVEIIVRRETKKAVKAATEEG